MLRVKVAAAIAIGAAPSAAHAYGLKTSSSGDPLRWSGGEILFEIALENGPPEVDDAQAVGAVDLAMASWRAALEGTGVTLAMNASSGAIASGDGINSLRWAVDATDPDVQLGLVAITNLSYEVDGGSIEEADVVVNAAEFAWSATPETCAGQYDLDAALTHEFGHVLGLGHSQSPDATMFATGRPCETLKRDLMGDDEAAIDYLYRDLPPPGGIAPSPLTCAAAGGSSSPAAVAALAVLAALVGLARGRRARVLAPLFAGSMLAALVGPAGAAQLREVALGELGARADLVVRGVVVAVEPAADGELATDSEVEVTECLAGSCPDTVRVRRLGGEQGGRGLWVDGEAELEVGEEVVLYLRERAGRPPAVVGGVQGALRLIERGGATYAVRDLRGHHVVAGGGLRRGGVELIDMTAVRRSARRSARR